MSTFRCACWGVWDATVREGDIINIGYIKSTIVQSSEHPLMEQLDDSFDK